MVLDVSTFRQKIHAQRDRWRTAHRRSPSINTLNSHVWVSSRCCPSPYEQSVFIVHKFYEKLIGTRPLRGFEPATIQNPRPAVRTPSHRRSTIIYYSRLLGTLLYLIPSINKICPCKEIPSIRTLIRTPKRKAVLSDREIHKPAPETQRDVSTSVSFLSGSCWTPLECTRTYHFEKVQELALADYTPRVQFCNWLLRNFNANIL